MQGGSESEVLLGFPQTPEAHRIRNDKLDETWSKIGGAPITTGYRGSGQEVDFAELKCEQCGMNLEFFCQVYAPVDDDWHRTLYLFACNTLACHALTGWKVVRLQRKQSEAAAQYAGKREERNESKPEKKPKSSGFAWGADSAFGGGLFDQNEASSKEVSLNDLETLLTIRDSQDVAKSTGKKSSKDKKKKSTEKCVVLEIDNEPEESVNAAQDTHVLKLLEKYNKEQRELGEDELAAPVSTVMDEEDEGSADESTGNEQEEGESYMDVFESRMERAPTQCLRYAYSGIPLWPVAESKRGSVKTSTCESCGATRVFEMQILAGAVWLWETCGNKANIDFSSLLVYSCPSSCENGTFEYAIALGPA
mmetsp:Transcript_6621/g.11693  ORF Transcript_6621/g.11693 Transcript_6621/m.11693 type:complete len:365 (-) Transcript_6621:4231-5325(-)